MPLYAPDQVYAYLRRRRFVFTLAAAAGGAADVAEVVFYNEDSATPMTINKPAGFGTGQRLIFLIADDSGVLADLTAPASGWTPITGGSVDITGQRGNCWYHDYDGTEPSTWNFGYNSGAAVSGALLRITNVDAATAPLAVTGNSGSNGASMDSPSVTPNGANDLLIVAMSNSGANAAFSATDPSGTTDLGQIQVANLFQGLMVAKQLLASGAATGVRTWTSISPTARQAGTWSIAIKSGAGGPVTHNADATLALTASLTTAGTSDRPAAAALAVTATLVAALTADRPASYGLAATATLSAGATRTATVAAPLAVTATTAAAADRTAAAAAVLAATGTLAAAVVGDRPAGAVLAATATLTAATQADRPAAASLAITATLTTAGLRTAVIDAALPVTATTTIAATATRPATAVLALTATLGLDAVVGTPPIQAAAALTVTATLTAGAALTAVLAANLPATATLTTAAQATYLAVANLTLTAGLTTALALTTTTGALLPIAVTMLATLDTDVIPSAPPSVSGRIMTAKMRAMLNYSPGQICPICNLPMLNPHAGLEDLTRIGDTWHVVHRTHHIGTFPNPEPDPARWPTW